MNFKIMIVLSIVFLGNFQVNAMPDLLRLDEERIIYWQEKKLGRTLSTYEKQQLLNSYIYKSGRRKVSLLTPPLNYTKSDNKRSFNYAQNPVLDTLSEVKILTILVDFPDLKSTSPGLDENDTDMFYDNYAPSHYENLLFSETGFEGPNNQKLKSARQFYQEVTGQNFDLTGSVYGWITAKNNAAFYGKRNGDERDVNVDSLVTEAVEALVQQGVDLSQYDNTDLNDIDGDGNINEPDGVIDHILLFHSSIGEEAGGGILGENAIWSHRFFVTENNQPASIYGSSIKAYNYTINPIDAGIGVVVHEFGHDLGLPDEYDLKNTSIGEPVANWSVMSSGSWMGELRGSKPVMFSPKNLDYLQTRFGGNWTKQTNINLQDIVGTKTLELAHAGIYSNQSKQIKIQLPPTLEDFIKPNSGNLQFYSGEGNKLNNQMSFKIDLPESTNITLKMLSQFNIESDYDFFQVYANSQPIAGNVTKAIHPNYENVKHFIDGNSFSGNGIEGEFVELSYDLSTYSTEQVTITFVYQTDEAVSGYGIVIDDIKILANNNVVYLNDTDSNELVVLNGFRKIGRYKSGSEHAYYLQLRSHLGLDEGLRLAQYASGLTLWYSNEKYDDNNTSEHQGYGDLLVIDTDQRPIYKANNVSVADSTIQVRDAALRLTDQSAGLGDNDLSPITAFEDNKDYSFAVQPESGVNIPKYGLKIDVIDISDNFDAAQIALSYQQKTGIDYVVNDKQVSFEVNGFIFEETDSFLWKFSDGQTSKELKPVILFENFENVSVTFTQTKLSGQTFSESLELNLTKALTISELNVSYADGVVTGSVEVIAGVSPYTITWDLGDGNSKSGQSITHKYAQNGTYTIKVSVKDNNGDTVSQSKQFTINVPIEISTDIRSADLSLTATASISGGSGSFDISWDFGDGNVGSGANTTHTYTDPGTYMLTTTVNDKDTNKSSSKSATVTVSQKQESNSSSGGSLFFILLASVFGIRRLR
jgi:immune inhibitor A